MVQSHLTLPVVKFGSPVGVDYRHSDCGVEWENKTLVPCLKIAFYLDPCAQRSSAVVEGIAPTLLT